MASELNGKRIAFVATDMVEQVELTEPWKAVEQAGGTPELLSHEEGEIQGFNHLDKADTFPVDRRSPTPTPTSTTGSSSRAASANPDQLRIDENAVALRPRVLRAGQAGRRDLPRAVDAHRGGRRAGPDADVVAEPADRPAQRRRELGRRGGHVDNGLVTSRKPDDLPAFCRKLVEEFAEGTHERRLSRSSARRRREHRRYAQGRRP